jgi:tetratricopeptide (TPR) repeat protein
VCYGLREALLVRVGWRLTAPYRAFTQFRPGSAKPLASICVYPPTNGGRENGRCPLSFTSLLLAGAISSTGLLLSLDDDARKLEARAVDAYRLGDYRNAEAFHRQAIATSPSADPETAVAWSNLGLAIYQQGRYPEAEQAFTRALSMQQQLFGESDPVLAKTLNNLALVQRSRGLTLHARGTLQRALEIENRAPGVDARLLAATAGALGAVYFDLEQYAAAEKLFRQALAWLESAGDEAGRAATLTCLARFESGRKNFANAEALLSEALSVRERLLGPDHPKTAETRNHLAQVYSLEAKNAEAEATFRRAIESLERSGGSGSPQLANPLLRYADHLRRQGRYDDADPLYRRSLELLAGREDDTLPELYSGYAEVLKKTHRKRQSNEYMAKARALQEQRPGRHIIDVSAFRE